MLVGVKLQRPLKLFFSLTNFRYFARGLATGLPSF